MQAFNFESASDPQEAVKSHQSTAHSHYLAGGTNIVDLLKLHVETPNHLVDILSLKLKSIHEDKKSFQVGALVTNSELAHHPAVQKSLPMLSEAILSGASPQLRNLATTSGNLLQRTRCTYFRDTACPCNKREPGSGCSAIGGVNRNLAILGVSSSCIASNPSDMNVALMALDANIQTQNRSIKISDFYTKPGKTPHIETILERDELITGVEIPKMSWYAKSTYVKVRDRASYSFALTSAAVALDLHQGIVKDSRIAMGGIGTIPWRAKEVEDLIKGQKFNMNLIAKASEIVTNGAQTQPGNKFKIELAKRTLTAALQKCGGLV